MATNKTTGRSGREARLRVVGARYIAGASQAQIAQELGISQQQVSYDLAIVQQRWVERTTMDLDQHRAEELARLDVLEREYWEAWERSKQPAEQTQTDTNDIVDPAAPEIRKTRLERNRRRTQQRDGNPVYLAGIERCIELRCKILGLYQSVKVAPTSPDGGGQYQRFFDALADYGRQHAN
jgi:hypothetical protein